MDKNQLIYSVVSYSFMDGYDDSLKVELVTLDKAKALAKVKELADAFKKDVADNIDEYSISEDEGSFSAWRDAEFTLDHYDVIAYQNELQ